MNDDDTEAMQENETPGNVKSNADPNAFVPSGEIETRRGASEDDNGTAESKGTVNEPANPFAKGSFLLPNME